MEAKFTKGPAVVEDWGEPDYLDGIEAQFAVKSIVEDSRLAFVFDEADAHLYAAAPEMYAALEKIAHRVPIMASEGEYRRGQEDALDACRKAAMPILAKARGET